MCRTPPRSTRSYTLVPHTSRFRSARDHTGDADGLELQPREQALGCDVGQGAAHSVASVPRMLLTWLDSTPPLPWHSASSAPATWRAPASPRSCRTRSEEHTSELQSLMRISYAVFCLKKNT